MNTQQVILQVKMCSVHMVLFKIQVWFAVGTGVTNLGKMNLKVLN
jgi:hypothetical protein